jgi:3-(3-hydroxy-phenyl)propionate hydroxylase
MNSGLRDACNLAWKLALVLHGQARSHILETYQQERMPHVIQMIRFATSLGNYLVLPMSRPRAFFRDIALRALVKLPPVASSIVDMRAKPATFYKYGFILAGNLRQGRFAVGRLLPQPIVRLAGDRSVLLDELLGSGFALLRLHSDPTVAFKPLRANLWQKLRPRCICLVPEMCFLQDPCESVTSALDDQQQIARFLRGRRDHFVLVRPDRHILGLFRADREHAFASALQERFF